MTTIGWRRSSRVLVGLAVLWWICLLGLVVAPLSSGIKGDAVPLLWAGLLCLSPATVILIGYWLVEPAAHAIRRRIAGRGHA